MMTTSLWLEFFVGLLPLSIGQRLCIDFSVSIVNFLAIPPSIYVCPLEKLRDITYVGGAQSAVHGIIEEFCSVNMDV